MNWECPGCEDVFENLVICIDHMWSSNDIRHEEKGDIPGWPEPTDVEANGDDMWEETVQHALSEFEDGDELVSAVREHYDMDLPPVLTRREVKDFDAVTTVRSLIEDMTKIEEDVEELDRIFSFLLTNWDDIVEGNGSPQIEAGVSSGPSQGDVYEAEEDTMSWFFDQTGVLEEEMRDTFLFIFEHRREDGVSVADVATELGVPEDMAADVLDNLKEDNFINYDPDDERYFVIW